MPKRTYVTPSQWLEPDSRWPHLEYLMGSSWRFRLRDCSMFRNPDLSPVRNIPTRSAMRFEGHAQSAKNLRRLPWEAEHELLLIKSSEVTSDVVSYWAQPLRLDLTWETKIDGTIVQKNAQYFPDAERLLANGRSQIVETKADYADATFDLPYVEKLLVAKAFLEKFGYEFLLVSAREDLSNRNVNRSINLVYLDRFAALETKDRLRLANHMASCNGRSIYRDVCRAISGLPGDLEVGAPDKVHAAIVRRLIGYDTSIPLMPTTEVWSVPPLDSSLPKPNTPRPTIQYGPENVGGVA